MSTISGKGELKLWSPKTQRQANLIIHDKKNEKGAAIGATATIKI